MTALPPPADPTLEAIDDAIVAREAANDAPRGYLGMSAIGDDCARKLWFNFRWAHGSEWTADVLRRFEDGHRGEDLMADRLRMLGKLELHTETNGEQFGFSAHGGHFRGHMDGALRGLIQAPVTWHVWEHKVSETAPKLEAIKASHGEKGALKEWSPRYYAQAQVYMHYSGMTRHYLTADTPGGRRSFAVRTDYDKDEAERLEARALRIIQAPEPPAGVSESPSWWQCKSCSARHVCHRGEHFRVNCRTCIHATPEMDGDARWSCALHGVDLSTDQQAKGCDQHRVIPALIAAWAKPVDADEEANSVTYESAEGVRFVNGELASDVLAQGRECVSTDPAASALREMGARVVSGGFGAEVVW